MHFNWFDINIAQRFLVHRLDVWCLSDFRMYSCRAIINIIPETYSELWVLEILSKYIPLTTWTEPKCHQLSTKSCKRPARSRDMAIQGETVAPSAQSSMHTRCSLRFSSVWYVRIKLNKTASKLPFVEVRGKL